MLDTMLASPRLQELDGKVALITGAARGLGRSHAVTFAEAGADLVLIDLCRDDGVAPYPLATRRQLERTALDCRRLGSRVVTAQADIRSEEEVRCAVAAGLTELERIDVLVNNAGILGPGGRPAHELTDAEWLLGIDVNLNGAWRCAKAVLPGMIAARAGSIVNIASTGGVVGFELFAVYVAAKHGVIGLTKALALEYGRYGIRVNAVCPSTIRAEPELESASTEAVATALGSSLSDYEESSRSFHPLRTLVRARDVSLACVWLASDAAVTVTGAAIPVDAGYLAR
jgi:NAD(P)-dependent dehydrogenase (short-subunit alcohol dehydrogenase family)